MGYCGAVGNGFGTGSGFGIPGFGPIKMDLILVLSFFVAGIGCGYFLRDHLSNKRRYWSSKRDKQTATPRLLDRTSFFRIDKAMSSLLFVASAGRFTGYDPG